MNVGDAALHQLFDRLERLPWPNPLMGKPEEDEQKLINAIDRWIVLLPEDDAEGYLLHRGSAEELKACAEVVLAAAAWAYWKRDPWLVAHPASAIEARRAATTGAVHESAVPQADAQGPSS